MQINKGIILDNTEDIDFEKYGEIPRFKISSIYKFALSVCLLGCLYPINVKTAEPIGSKFFVGHHVTTGKVYE